RYGPPGVAKCSSVTHFPASHRVVPPPVGQTSPQRPQFSMSDWRFVSQPVVASPSQLSKPASQDITTHAPSLQPSVARGAVPQTTPEQRSFGARCRALCFLACFLHLALALGVFFLRHAFNAL